MAKTTHRTQIVRERPSTYLAILNEQLEIRAREYGEAWVTAEEDAWIRAHDPERRHRYSILDGTRTGSAQRARHETV